MHSCQRNLNSVFLRIASRRFYYLKFILEAYDNLAILSSVDSKAGLVVIKYPPGAEEHLFALLADIEPQLQ